MRTAANSYDHTTLLCRNESSESPSFDSYSSGNHLADIAARVVNEFNDEDDNPYDEICCSSSCPQSYAIHHLPQDKSTPEEDEGRRNDRDVEDTTHYQSPDHAKSEEIKARHTKNTKIEDDKTSKRPNKEDNSDEEESESEFEFAIPGAEDGSSPISADEIFQNGQIRPLFPLFNIDLIHANSDTRYDSTNPRRLNHSHSATSDASPPLRLPLKKLLIEDRDPTSCSSSEADDLDGVAPDTYCVWTPDQSNRQVMSKKSNSTGSSSKRWRLRHFLYRSHSDGSREPFFGLPERGNKEEQQRRNSTSSLLALESKSSEQQRKGKVTKERKLPPVSAKGSNSYMDKNWAERKADRRKKSYLPYRQDLLGFFSGVNGSV